jgi:hypothetical protein
MMPENGPALPTSYCVLGTAWRPQAQDADPDPNPATGK